MKIQAFYCIGFFGCPNFGDEVLCTRVVGRLEQLYPDSTRVVMTRSAAVSAAYTGLQEQCVEGFWPDPAYYAHLYRHLCAVVRSDLILIGGGGLISDKYTPHALGRYCIDPLIGIVLNKRYVFVGIGVVPIKRRLVTLLARFVVSHAAAVACRDERSKERLKRLGVANPIAVGPDLAFLAPHQIDRVSDGDYAIINLRQKPELPIKMISDLCERMLCYSSRLVFLAAEKADVCYYQKLLASLPDAIRAKCEINDPAALSEAVTCIAQAKLVAAMRLHVNVLAAAYHRPLLAICYEDKVRQFAGRLSGPCLACEVDAVAADQIDRIMAPHDCTAGNGFDTLVADCRATFDRAVEDGLKATGHALATRLGALMALGLMLGYGAGYAVLIMIKRLLFGRGPICIKKMRCS